MVLHVKKIIFSFWIFLCFGSQSMAQKATTVQFMLNEVPVNMAKHVGIRGNNAPLSWEKSIPLEKKGDAYHISLEFASSIDIIEFKFVLFDTDDKPIWEGTQNRSLELNEEQINFAIDWDVEQMIDISTLPLLQPSELMKDYQLIETMVLKIHPGTFRYNDQAAIQAALQELKEKFQSPLTHGEAYLAISKVTAKIQCDHTKAGFNNQNKVINSVIHRQKDKLPFTFRWIENKMIVIYDATAEQQLPKGTAIQRINGVPVLDIQKAMMPYIGADGATNKSRLVKMEIEGYDFRYNAFDVFYPLLFPIKNETLQLDIKLYEQEQARTVTTESLTREARNKTLIARYPEFPKTRDDLWHFEVTENKTAILRLNSFGLLGWKAMTIDYKEYFEKVFKQLKKEKVEHLIIDIRKNNGGNDEILTELFTYFEYDRKKIQWERERRTRFQQFPESIKPYVQSWGNPWYYDLKPDRVDEANGYYIFEEKSEQPAKKKRNAFKGELYLLISPANASLAYYFARGFEQNKMGTLIGQETGGNKRGINGGQILFLRLPNSGIEIDHPIMGGFTLKAQANQGVLPNLEVTPSVDDIYKGIDREMEAALKQISTR